MERAIIKIWKESRQFQGARGFLDKKHGIFVFCAAKELCALIPNANNEVVIPAAIMHDIGYSRCSDEELIAVNEMRNGRLGELCDLAKRNHMVYGAEMAQAILDRVNYDPRLIDSIVGIIARHDLQDDCISLDESIVRDADKVWRYTRYALANKTSPAQNIAQVYRYFLENLGKPHYFYNSASRELAKREMAASLLIQT